MRTGLRQSVWIGCGLLALCLLAWSHLALLASAAQVSVSQVRVTVCGNGIVEGVAIGGTEECDPGKHCANSTACTTDAQCAGIGDGLCKVIAFGSCSADCKIIVAGSKPLFTQVSINEITARPEQRYLGNGGNYDTLFYFYLLNADNLNHQVVYQHPSVLLSNASGVASPYATLPDNVIPGVYDALIKPKAHLAKLQNNVYLQAGENSLNFTNPDNGPTIGSATLIAGDIDGAGNSPTTFGDNVINAVDISVLLSQIGSSDPSGNANRANLNQDTVVDQSDLNILLGNIDKQGDQ